jgi:ribosome-associated protein
MNLPYRVRWLPRLALADQALRNSARTLAENIRKQFRPRSKSRTSALDLFLDGRVRKTFPLEQVETETRDAGRETCKNSLSFASRVTHHALRHPTMPIEVTPDFLLPDDSITLRFIRAGGPGGQNVNKVASAVQLRFDPAQCPRLSVNALARLHRLAGRRLTDSGEIVISAQRFRTQEHNKRDALDRLVEMVGQALVEPKLRRATKPTRASKERRLVDKQQRGSVKTMRNRVRGEE